jgi:hypothetical protein
MVFLAAEFVRSLSDFRLQSWHDSFDIGSAMSSSDLVIDSKRAEKLHRLRIVILGLNQMLKNFDELLVSGHLFIQ